MSLGVLVLSACAPDVAETPHVSLLQLRRAVEAGDTTTTLQYIDVDAIVARLMRDLLAAARDSFNIPAEDTLRTEFRTRVDSVEGAWRALLRTQLGLSTSTAAGRDTVRSEAEAADEDQLAPDATDDVLAGGVEIVGDGPVRYVGDTALVDRMLRYAYFDTSATLRLALVPVEQAHWRVVAFHNSVALAHALRHRQITVLQRANKPLRDSIRARVVIRDVTISRVPLEEWDRYAAEVHVTIQNRTTEPIVLYSAHLVGPDFPLGDSVGQILPHPITLGPASTRTIVWRRPLRGAHDGPYDVVARPTLYAIEIADVGLGGTPPSRVQLYRTWQDFVKQNPPPMGSSGGVLAHGSARSPGALATATDRSEY